MLHGENDPIVPIEQAISMVEAVRNGGGRAKLHVFEGEGHEWRRGESISKALELELEWYQTVLNDTTETVSAPHLCDVISDVSGSS